MSKSFLAALVSAWYQTSPLRESVWPVYKYCSENTDCLTTAASSAVFTKGHHQSPSDHSGKPHYMSGYRGLLASITRKQACRFIHTGVWPNRHYQNFDDVHKAESSVICSLQTSGHTRNPDKKRINWLFKTASAIERRKDLINFLFI